MKKTPVLLGFLAAIVLTAACVSCRDSEDTDKITLTLNDNGRAVPMSTGGTLEIILSGHPTAGYEWTVARVDEKVVEPRGSSFKAQSDLVGAPGEYVFRFRAIAAGATPVRLIYKRPFESHTENAFQVQVTVQ